MNLYSAMVDACHSIGVTPPDTLPAPGKFHKADIHGDPHGKGDARIKTFLDGEGGIAHNWKTNEQQVFFASGSERLSPEQRVARQQAIAAARTKAEEERMREHEQSAEKAVAILNKAGFAPENHRYLTRKGIKPHGVKLSGDDLAIPMRADGDIQSAQFISPDGAKRFLTGGRVAGCYFSLGNPKKASALCIAEGFATGATIHEATGHPVAVAFNAGNLLPVAKVMHEKFPDLPIILCADDDWKTNGNPGITKATEAALAVGGLLAIPVFSGERPDKATDFNDMASLHDLEAVKRVLAEARVPVIAEPQLGSESPPEGESGRTVELIRGSDITPEAVEWFWHGWLAAGKMHVLGGAPGTGKTTISMALAATVSTGGRWPDGSRSPMGNVVIWSGEDSPSDTLVPRLTLSGADMNNVYFISDVVDGKNRHSFDPAKDMEPLRRKLTEIGGVRLLIVDPIVSAVAGDSHKNAEVRRDLQPLVELAESMHCALLGITHFSKGTGGRDPVERLTGSLAFGALARIVLVAAKQQEEGEGGRAVRIFLRAKSNIGPDDGGFEYDLSQGELKAHPGVFSSCVLWGGPLEGAARDLLATADDASEDGESMSSAKRFLADLLSFGQMRANEVFKEADGAGYSKRSIQRAADKLGVLRHKDGMKGGWIWKLPPKMPIPAEDAEDAEQNYLAPTAPSVANVSPSHYVEVEI